MINTDILRRLRYAFNFDDPFMLEIFRLGGRKVTVDALKSYLKKEEEEGYSTLPDELMIAFLDGLIIRKRGVQKNGPAQPVRRELLNNNLVLRKIRIALELRDEDILEILKRSEMEVSKSELSALFRQKDHKNFKICGDQLLRNFLAGLAGYRKPKPVQKSE